MFRRGKAARFSGVSEGLCRPARYSRRSCDALEPLGNKGVDRIRLGA